MKKINMDGTVLSPAILADAGLSPSLVDCVPILAAFGGRDVFLYVF
jgi:hypothetical protein